MRLLTKIIIFSAKKNCHVLQKVMLLRNKYFWHTPPLLEKLFSHFMVVDLTFNIVLFNARISATYETKQTAHECKWFDISYIFKY